LLFKVTEGKSISELPVSFIFRGNIFLLHTW
jgi:hypothetical protein